MTWEGGVASDYVLVKEAAVAAFRRGDFAVAADLLLPLIGAGTGDVPGWGSAEISYNLGQCLLQLQDYDGARYYFEQACGRSTHEVNERAHELLQRLERLDDALAVVEPHLA